MPVRGVCQAVVVRPSREQIPAEGHTRGFAGLSQKHQVSEPRKEILTSENWVKIHC